MTETRRNAAAVALLVALLVIVFADILFFGRALYFRDVTRFYYPSKKVVHDIVRAGEFPAWNPYWDSGQPLAANPDYGTFYPGQWVLLLPGFDFWFRMHIVLHLCLAAAGAFVAIRRWTARIESAFFAGIVFSLGGLTLSLTCLLPYLYCIAWLPWILWAVDRLVEEFSLSRFAVSALLIALPMLGGEPVTLAQVCLLAIVLAAVRGKRWRAAASVAIAEAVAAIVAAVQIVPAFDLLRDSSRVRGFSFAVVSKWSTPPLRLLDLLVPQFTGAAAEHFRFFWGTAKYGWLDPFFPAIYFGVVPIALAIAGLTARVRGWRVVAALFAGSMLLAFGAHTPLLRVLYEAHLFRAFRYPEKFLILGVVPLMLFSAIAFDRAMEGERRIVKRALAIAIVAVVIPAVLLLISFGSAYVGRFVAFWDIGISPFAGAMAQLSRVVWLKAFCAAIFSTAALMVAARDRSAKWARLAIAVTLVDLGYQRLSVAETVDGDFFRTAPAAVQRMNRNVRLFHQAEWYGAAVVARRYLDLPQMYWVVRNGLFPMIGATWGIGTAMNGDIDETFLAPAADFNAAMIELRARNVPRWFEPLMAMSAAGYRALYLPFEQQVARASRDPESIQPIIFLPVRTNPVFYFADRIVQCRSREELVNAIARGGMTLRTALADLAPFVPAEARVIAARRRFNSADVEVESSGNALLVCSITRHKYWSATIDGRRVSLIPVNLQFQGVMVPAGRHAIHLQYRNSLLVAGGIVSIAALVLLVALIVRDRMAIRAADQNGHEPGGRRSSI